MQSDRAWNWESVKPEELMYHGLLEGTWMVLISGDQVYLNWIYIGIGMDWHALNFVSEMNILISNDNV